MLIDNIFIVLFILLINWSIKCHFKSRQWWHMPVIPAFGRQRKTNLIRLRPDWSTKLSRVARTVRQRKLVLKNKTITTKMPF